MTRRQKAWVALFLAGAFMAATHPNRGTPEVSTPISGVVTFDGARAEVEA